jgi:hypothetical protein
MLNALQLIPLHLIQPRYLDCKIPIFTHLYSHSFLSSPFLIHIINCSMWCAGIKQSFLWVLEPGSCPILGEFVEENE